MNVCVIGAGYVGLVTGTCFAEFGVNVICVDIDEDKVNTLRRGEVPIYEPGLKDLLTKNLREGRLDFTTDIEAAIKSALVIFIAVGTPRSSTGEANLSDIDEAAATIGRCMTDYKVVVTKSTVPVGTSRRIAQIIKDNQTEQHPFDVVSNPEFLREGAAIEDFMRPNRVILGAETEQAVAILKDLYRPLYLIETPFIITNLETAELIKYASNTFLATKISFINEMANICELVGADVHHVARGMGLDKRIGPKFLHPGPGFGGSCFPKDVKAIYHMAKEHGYNFNIAQSVIEVNDGQRLRMIEKIEATAGDLNGQVLAVLGLTFKPNTDDIREAPAIYIIKDLLAKGAVIKAFDPVGMENARRELPDIEYADDAYSAIEGADALIIVTEWNQFRNLDWNRIKNSIRKNVVIDLKNIYEPEKMRELGFTYSSVGR